MQTGRQCPPSQAGRRSGSSTLPASAPSACPPQPASPDACEPSGRVETTGGRKLCTRSKCLRLAAPTTCCSITLSSLACKARSASQPLRGAPRTESCFPPPFAALTRRPLRAGRAAASIWPLDGMVLPKKAHLSCAPRATSYKPPSWPRTQQLCHSCWLETSSAQCITHQEATANVCHNIV